jgi:hypothetical protein
VSTLSSFSKEQKYKRTKRNQRHQHNTCSSLTAQPCFLCDFGLNETELSRFYSQRKKATHTLPYPILLSYPTLFSYTLSKPTQLVHHHRHPHPENILLHTSFHHRSTRYCCTIIVLHSHCFLQDKKTTRNGRIFICCADHASRFRI